MCTQWASFSTMQNWNGLNIWKGNCYIQCLKRTQYYYAKFEAVVNTVWLLVPTGKLIVTLTCSCKVYLLNVHYLGDLHCFCSHSEYAISSERFGPTVAPVPRSDGNKARPFMAGAHEPGMKTGWKLKPCQWWQHSSVGLRFKASLCVTQTATFYSSLAE